MFTVEAQPDQVTYLPDYRNNRELAEAWFAGDEEGQRPFFWVELLPMTSRDYNSLAGRVYRKHRGNFVSDAQKLVGKLMERYVPVVGGLSFQRKDGTVVTPTSGKALYDAVEQGYYGLGDIVDDIVAALKDLSVADEGDLKKLRQRFAGSRRPETQATDGDAQSATPTTSTTTTVRGSQTTD